MEQLRMLLVVLALGESVNSSAAGGRKRMRVDEFLAAKRRHASAAPMQVRTVPPKDRSTSSDSQLAKTSSGPESGTPSLEISSLSQTDSHEDPLVIKSDEAHVGWRKWHRDCQLCPDDAEKVWRDHRIKWICGAYQSARRTFKSMCSMHLRNCQDGTLFVKIHDLPCSDDKRLEHGKHFFYEYHVFVRDETVDVSDLSSNRDTVYEDIMRRAGASASESIFPQFDDDTNESRGRPGIPPSTLDHMMKWNARTAATSKRSTFNDLEEAMRAVSDFGLSLANRYMRTGLTVDDAATSLPGGDGDSHYYDVESTPNNIPVTKYKQSINTHAEKQDN